MFVVSDFPFDGGAEALGQECIVGFGLASFVTHVDDTNQGHAVSVGAFGETKKVVFFVERVLKRLK